VLAAKGLTKIYRFDAGARVVVDVPLDIPASPSRPLDA
jgi:hypothetical protein